MGNTGTNWIDVASVLAAVFAAITAIAVPVTSFARRPKLSLLDELSLPDSDERIHSRIEGGQSAIPWFRLLVLNERLRRAAHGTRVLVEHYHERSPDSKRVTMGSPELGWPSTEIATGGGAVLFAGGLRPVDFGSLFVGRRDDSNMLQVNPMLGWSQALQQVGAHWEWRLALAMHGDGIFLVDMREHLPPTPHGYSIRLLVGADDGAAGRYDVDIDWNGAAPDPESAFASVRIAVRPVSRRRRRVGHGTKSV